MEKPELKLDADSCEKLQNVISDLEKWAETSSKNIHLGYEKAERLTELIEENPKVIQGIIQHDIRNHLTFVQGKLDLLTGYSDAEITEESFDDIKNSIFLISNIINSLIFWTAEEKFSKIEKINISELMKQLIPNITKYFTGRMFDSNLYLERSEVHSSYILKTNKEQITYVLFQIENDLEVLAHQATIVTLLMNIVSNAREHNANLNRINNILEIKLYRSNQGIRIDVRDNGNGVDKETAKHIFKFGFSSKKYPNRGIGLAYAPERLELMNGKIYCDPHGGLTGGANFSIILPETN